MASWGEFEALEPDVAAEGRRLLYRFGPGLAFLATLRADGACPVIDGPGLYGFLIDSPKRADLERDGRYTLHTYPPEAVDDEFMVAGTAVQITDPVIRARVEPVYRSEVDDDERFASYELFEFGLERALLSTYRHRGDWPPTRAIWRDRSA